MRCDFFEYVPEFKLLIAGNHRPGLRSVDEAIRRRLHMVPFTVTISPSERDPSLAEKLRAEFSGIMQWAVKGCLAWQNEGLNPPSAVRAETESDRSRGSHWQVGSRTVALPASSIGRHHRHCSQAGRNGVIARASVKVRNGSS